MATESVTVTRAVCDGCGRAVIGTEPGEMPPGIHGTVFEIDDAGGRGGDFFACKRRCIPAAVSALCGDKSRTAPPAEPDAYVGDALVGDAVMVNADGPPWGGTWEDQPEPPAPKPGETAMSAVIEQAKQESALAPEGLRNPDGSLASPIDTGLPEATT